MTTSLEQQHWLEIFATNQWVIDKQLDGLTHEDSLIMPPFRANCLNWVVGHIVEHRDWMLRALDEPSLMPARLVDIYRRGSQTIQVGDEVADFSTLLDYIARSKTDIIGAMQRVTLEFLAEKPQTGILMPNHKDKTRLERLQGLLWHETYHTGQLELLRQLAGKDDAVLT